MRSTWSPMLVALFGVAALACTDKGGDDSGSVTDGGSTDGGGADGGTDGGGTDGGTTGDGGAVEITDIRVDLPAMTDECREVCGTLSVTGTGTLAGIHFQIESDLDGFLEVEGTLDAKGQADFCIPGPLSTGEHRLAFHLDAQKGLWGMGSLTVKPFGWAYGLDKPTEILDEPDWVPEFTTAQLQADPVFTWTADTWTAVSVLAPATVWYKGTRFLYFAGTPDTSFYLGVATSTGNTDFVEYAGNPILTAAQTGAIVGDWDYYAQNTPEALVVGDELWLYYNGRSGETGGLNIGLATSTDGLHFERIAENPVLAPTGVEGDFDSDGIAHPSVEMRDVDFADNEAGAVRVTELWYASGTLEIGYALSADGVTFERYCDGSVFAGQGGTWDLATVKAPEVKYWNDRYYMTYSGCGQGCYQVGWAASNDGVRWAQAEGPVIPIQPAGDGGPRWNSYGTQEAFLEIDDDGLWRFWYAGTGDNHGSVGILELRP